MAIIRASPNLLRRLTRSLNSSASPPIINLSEKLDHPLIQNPSNTTPPPTTTSSSVILNFDDHDERLFASVSNSRLLRSLLNLELVAIDPVVDLGMWVMKSGMIESVILRDLVLGVIKRTFYEHFCAGESLEEASRTLRGLWDDGLRGILDYGLEDAIDNASCDRNLNEFIKTVESSRFLPPSSVSYACAKITAICPITLLKRASDLLRWERKDPLFNLPWKMDTLPLLSDSSPFYHTLKRPDPLTAQEEQDLQQAHQRLMKLSQKCFDMNLPLLVDAEYTSVQPAIDYLTYSAMVRFNRDNNPIVFGTIQAYLKDAKDRIVKATEAAEQNGIAVGLKLVRGAYLSSETKLASSLGVASPIHENIEETHSCYNECASFMLEKVSKGSAAVLLATHNLESGRAVALKAQALGIGKENQRLQFAQLKGMAEGLSFGLRSAGFQVSKYLPYGPVEKVMPYLLRRAEENRGLLSASTLDRQLMRRELIRRIKAAVRGGEVEKMRTSINH